MPRKTKSEDPENPLWTPERVAAAKRRDQLPPEIQAIYPRRRGPGKRPAKVSVTIRLSRDAVDRYKATGEGWQTRMNEAIERSAARLPTPRNA